MKSLLRKKSPTDNVQKPSPPPSTQYTRQPPTTETPLYARFSSIKPAAQPLEKTRLVVSGPMPLGRPSRTNLGADSRRKHEDENPLRGRPNGRRVASPESQLEAHEFQPAVDRSSQDVPVDPRPPIKTRTACKSHTSPFPSRADVLISSVMPSWMTCTRREHLSICAWRQPRLVWLQGVYLHPSLASVVRCRMLVLTFNNQLSQMSDSLPRGPTISQLPRMYNITEISSPLLPYRRRLPSILNN